VSIKLLEPVFDKVFIDKSKEVLACVVVQVVILFGCKRRCLLRMNLLVQVLAVNFIKKIQVYLYDKVVVQDLEFFHKNNSGKSFNAF
jgi:ABC-type multidrug transport system fused ATPase/permease subunit